MSGKKTKQAGDTPGILRLTVGPDDVSRFFPLFQEGVVLETETGGSVREFLCSTLGIDEGYVEGRISTIFLNSKPVDDLDTSIVDDGSVLALSAAMPGLVGATMRRGGYYAAMRSAISYHPGEAHAAARQGRVRLKLFNMILEEIGPSLLASGVIARADTLSGIVAGLVRDGLLEAGTEVKNTDEARIVVVTRDGP
ncbi:MAG: hypothetical protein KBA15_10605 [Spirochaetes bacterium]|jgi:hypothetical protein|nr:hypothetical protein [Spirochaetota bacterium]